ncbi:MAG TPA: DUF2470 domain-containing protein [Mycobacterium sp.]|nr:DUF2470 domain-containing protein [Mycobacterium sp.]
MAAPAGTVPTTPTTAERIRSACVRGHALVAVAGAEPTVAPLCHLLGDGTVALALPDCDEVADTSDTALPPGEQALLELTDHAPLRLRERVRALVWIRGRLDRVPAPEVCGLLDRIAAEDPNPVLLRVRSPRTRATNPTAPADQGRYTLLRLTMESVVLADTTGAESVAVDDLLAARPDPFCAIEADWLRHLESKHPEVVARLAARLPASLRCGAVRPLGIDRCGVWLRVERPSGDHDIRLAFPRPVEDLAGLNRAVRVLMGCPFLNGLQARRR